MVDFSKASDVNKFFGDLIEQIADVKISGVYVPTYFITGENSDIFIQDENVYICFENNKCLVVDYKFVNKLSIDYRSMTEEEIENILCQVIRIYLTLTKKSLIIILTK